MERKEERRNIMGIGMRKRGGKMGKKERRSGINGEKDGGGENRFNRL